MLAAVNIRPDGYHPEITAPEQDDPRLPTVLCFENASVEAVIDTEFPLGIVTQFDVGRS